MVAHGHTKPDPTQALTFPQSWPDQPCPPSTAIDADGIVFRIVKTDPPSSHDFLSHTELGRRVKASCVACGISVFRKIEDAEHCAEMYPKLGNLIAKGELSPATGKTTVPAAKGASHITWWAYDGVIREQGFSCVRNAN